jgi:predicted ArsR family transcriptional regulator
VIAGQRAGYNGAAMHALDAVAHPVRLRIIRHLADAGPASLGELAKAAGVHENTARTHVAALEQGGLVTSERRPLDRPGRPGVNYRLVDEQLPAPSQLAQLLGAALDRAGPHVDDLRAVGRDWGRYLAGRPDGYDVEKKVPEVLEQVGFTARVRDGAVELSGCPCPSVLPGRPGLVCCLGEGVIEGVLDASGAPQRIGTAEHDPANRRCRVQIVEPRAGRKRDAS